MVSVNPNINRSNNFGQNTKQPTQQTAQNQVQPTAMYAESFINECEKLRINHVKGTKRQRESGLSTIRFLNFIPVIYAGNIFRKMIFNKLPMDKIPKSLLRVGATFVGISLAAKYLNKYFNSKTDKNYQKFSDAFHELNTDTNAKIIDKPLYLKHIYAGYYPAIGHILVDKNQLNDPIEGKKYKKIIRHELVHARQYETVARSKDGIKKVNFAVANTFKNTLNTPEAKNAIKLIYNDVMQNKDKYKNTTVPIGGLININMIDYLTAMNTLLNDKNAGMDDIPIIINTAHYQEVIDKKGPLTPEEEKKADKYYNAMINYVPCDINGVFNPWSDYRQNLLEKEAYKESPTLISRLAELVGKKNK